MVRLRLILTTACIVYAATAEAQTSTMTGMITGFIGVGHGGEVESKGATPGASMAIVESNGWGAEIDLAHVRRFNEESFTESGITTLMINAVGFGPYLPVRPFGEAGVGLLRVRAQPAGSSLINRTDWGFNAGGGVVVMVNDAVGIRGDVRYFRYFQRHADLPLNDVGFFDFWRTSIGATWTWPVR